MVQTEYRSNKNILLSSSIASVLSTTLTNPIQVAKLNRQYLVTTCPQYPHPNYRDFYDCSCSRFNFANSFKGIKVAIPQVLFSSILYTQLYQTQRKYLLQKIQSNSLATLTAAISSRFIVTTLMIPFESLRVRMGNLIKDQTMAANKGLKITLIRDLTFSALFWSLFEPTRNYLQGGGEYRNQVIKSSPAQILWSNLIAGVINGVIVSGITTPLDTVKTRIQSQAKNSPIIKEIFKIYSKQGLGGLFSGVHYRVTKSTLHTVLYLLIYEHSLREFGKIH